MIEEIYSEDVPKFFTGPVIPQFMMEFFPNLVIQALEGYNLILFRLYQLIESHDLMRAKPSPSPGS